MAADDVLVQFSMVQKTYDGATLVVKHLDLDIHRGEFLTLLGPSGSGKTTTLMMLAGFEMPTYGEIRLKDQAIDSLPPHKRNIGMVFQNYALFPHMTVAQNVGFPLSVRHMAREDVDEKVERVLSMVQLSEFGSRRPAQLSGGQQQRVALARALVFEPELVLMDEPLGALDKQLREQMQIEIKHLHEKLGLTVVYVTHDQSEALTMSNRVAVFNDGVIQQIDDPETLYEKPKNSFVANFIGENNDFDGMVTSIDGDVCKVRLGGADPILAKPVKVFGAGSKTTLSIRPERISLKPLSGEAVNRIPGRITESIYLGDHRRIIFETPDNPQVKVKLTAEREIAALRTGDTVDLWFRAEDCRALDRVPRNEGAFN